MLPAANDNFADHRQNGTERDAKRRMDAKQGH
jgi:hypothetical protein